jgi:Holliday junction resolvase-like predicted endonuclease
VDKTLFIKEVFVNTRRPKIMITAPRKFGKSVNLTMLHRFLELEVNKETGEQITKVDLEEGDAVSDTPNYKLFTKNQNGEELDLEIMKDGEFVKTHFGKYPVINVNFLCNETVTSKTNALNLCKESIHRAFRAHPYLSSNSQLDVDDRNMCKQWCTQYRTKRNRSYKQFNLTEVNSGLLNLSEYLHKFHKRKVFVLVDEFDSIISEAVENVTDTDQLKNIIKIVMNAIGTVVKGNEDNLAGIFITGILDLHGAGISPLLGSLKREVFGTDTSLLKFYGFNLDEVKKLFKTFSVDEKLSDEAIIKYNGYYTKNGETGIFNPYAIISFLETYTRGDESLKNYWIESGYVVGLNNIFKKDDIRTMIEDMLQGRTHSPNMSDDLDLNLDNLTNIHIANRDSRANISRDLACIFLLRQGYLSYMARSDAIGIPDDLRSVFIKKMMNHLQHNCGINTTAHQKCQEKLNKVMNVVNKDKAVFTEALKSLTDELGEIIETASLDPCNEAGIQSVVLTIVQAAGYTCAGEVYNTKGNRVDIIGHKDRQGIMIELKYNNNDGSRGAVTQIFTQGYYTIFRNKKHYDDKNNIKLRLLIGMHFTEKNQGSKVKATVHCLRDLEINEVLKELNIEEADGTECRIKKACAKEDGINSFVKKAIRVT